MSGADLDAAFAQYGSYGKWRSEADPATTPIADVRSLKPLSFWSMHD